MTTFVPRNPFVEQVWICVLKELVINGNPVGSDNYNHVKDRLGGVDYCFLFNADDLCARNGNDSLTPPTCTDMENLGYAQAMCEYMARLWCFRNCTASGGV